ncbi:MULTISPECIES: energy-coupling factor transporter transmembrane component T [Streptomyces]|uniref:Cobalt ABC transporter permease n=1 Tax=Streptomyces spororaveus TaxID=284039 RepID=A0ABQ3TK59_9ACTN|nr:MULTISPECIES: energy-coupling factor transporter transmembrane protein EcfT [Streptomyces]MCM9079316.1 energy-coupling factor transporter transmembrane protein EcfT [Streptomyces spororaveus]MCX5306258.1 energy-coupling factor transporter transmembrane protein EcfT [Streptomyces sp. NBC_00160]GHI80355.1 cobalt ABC transporter permease [Streptomyces spororaveus]
MTPRPEPDPASADGAVGEAAPAAAGPGTARPARRSAPTGPAADGVPPARRSPAGAPDGPGRSTYEKWRPPQATRATALHAGAWWLWALGLATAASRTTNPLLLGLIVGVAGYVVAARRTDAPWARSYGAFLKLGLFVIGLRLLFSMLLGSAVPGSHTLFTLPEIPLPAWAQGIRFGGRVTAEQLVFAFYDGLKLAALLVCVGAANALANPARLLKSLPAALYEAGVAVVVAMTFAPNMVADVVRLRTARRLRGRPTGGVKAVLQIGLPVLEGALERSVAIAASMDARGYGRTAEVPPAVRHTTNALTVGGLLGMCAGTYGLLAAQGAAYGLPVLGVGAALAVAGLRLGGRRSVRTRYRPDRWGVRAWLVAGSGAAVAGLLIHAGSVAPAGLHPGVVPLVAPTLPLWPAAAVLIGLLPAFVAPVPPKEASQ